MSQWIEHRHPGCLVRRFEFESYTETQKFLNQLADYSKAKNRFPDLSFGTTYVNVTLRSEEEDDNTEVTDEDYRFANEIDALWIDCS